MTTHSTSIPLQFRPPKSFKFPKRKFGTKGEERAFRADWCVKYDWLHYDVSQDAAFCYTCMRAEHENKFLSSKKHEPAFTKTGFTYWKEATTAFEKHRLSASHREAVESLVLLPTTLQGEVSDLLNNECRKEKQFNREMFMKILENTRFLARQGIALRGDNNETESNFIQLLHLRCVGSDIQTWLRKKSNKYTSHGIQNEVLKIMALQILGDVQKNVQAAGKYSILADECTDCSNKEQFTISLRYVDEKLEDHTDFIGLYAQDSISADSLAASIKDVLCRMNLKVSDCRGQCYDGASNMSGARNGVAAQIATEESRAIYTHCYCHALNLAISDALKNCKVCRDALDIAFEITKLVKFSPNRNVLFDTDANEDNESSVGIRTFCPTRWTVKGDSIESILVNCNHLFNLWNTCLETGSRLQSDIKCRILGVQSQMSNFSLLFGLQLCERILKITDNLSKTLQNKSLSAAEGQHVTKLTVTTLTKMRTSEAFDLFYKLLMNLQVQAGTNPPVYNYLERGERQLTLK